MSKICLIILCFSVFLSSLITTLAEYTTLQPITGGDVGGKYAFTIGNNEVSDCGVYDYRDDHMTIHTAIGSGIKSVRTEYIFRIQAAKKSRQIRRKLTDIFF